MKPCLNCRLENADDARFCVRCGFTLDWPGPGDAAGPARTAYERAVRLGREGDPAGARAAYERAIASGDPEIAPRAAFSLGAMAEEQSDPDGACVAYRHAIESGHDDLAPAAAFNLGV